MMLRFFVFVLIAAFSYQPALLAQHQSLTASGSAFRLGLRAGGNSVLPLEAVENATYHPTLSSHGGILANFSLGHGIWSLQPEVNYSQRRVKADYTSQGVVLAAQVFTNRVEVPLLLKATFGDPGGYKPRFFVNAGPFGAYVLQERYKANIVSYGSISGSLRTVIDAVVTSLNTNKATFASTSDQLSYGVAGGLGVLFQLGPGQLSLEGRALYELSRAKPTDPTGTGIPNRLNEKDYMLLQGSLGYIIPIGSR